jgi:hypothetical protein
MPMDIPLRNVISAITSRITAEGHWSLKTEELIAFLGADRTEYHRTVYAIKNRIHYSEAIDRFTDDSVGDLVTVLEQFCGMGVEEVFTREGLFLPQPCRIELMDIFLRHAHEALSVHLPDYGVLDAMMRVEGNFQDAYALYLDEHFSIGKMKEMTLDDFLARGDFGAPARMTASHYLDTLFRRHLITPRGLFLPLELTFAEYLRKKAGHSRPDGYNGYAGGANGNDRSSAVSRAFSIMELDPGTMTREELRSRYKSLIKRYHPDVNPHGLEKCKAINGAYSLLMQVVTNNG